MSTIPLNLDPSQINYAETAQWKLFLKQALANARMATPAFLVEDMNAVAQTVTAQIAIQERVRTTGAQQWWDVPPITNVPVMTPRGGGFAVTLPLKKGDEGLLIFCDTCFDLWWQNGQSGSSPAYTAMGKPPTVSGSQRQFEVRRHHVHDCGFYPSSWSQPNALATYSTDSLQIRTDDGTTTVVDVSASGVAIKGGSVTAANGGAAQALMTDAFYQYWVDNVLPWLEARGFSAGPPPGNSETTILKGQ